MLQKSEQFAHFLNPVVTPPYPYHYVLIYAPDFTKIFAYLSIFIKIFKFFEARFSSKLKSLGLMKFKEFTELD